MDVELFDNDKPETVRNFLLYVRSGAYSNSFLHRCVPGFVVQGGGFSVSDPLSSNPFSAYLEVTKYGRLANEFLVGPRISNTFATIAMAKVGDDPNSATSQWFFNLGDNSSTLDSQNGGFTVFGRVLESTNSNDGTNILQRFNMLSTNAGVVDLGNLLGPDYQVFSDLPVSYTNTTTRVPSDQELYYVRISILNQTNQTGQSPPAVSIVSPSPNSRFTNQTVTLRGTASDDVSVARVVYQVQGGPLEIATGTTNWEINVSPLPGWTTVTVESIDWEGNHSTNSASVTFFYLVQVPLNLQIVGAGTVVGATNGQALQVGRFYTLSATPAGGSVFQMWTGSVTSAAPVLTFQVPTNATDFRLTANFITDPLIRFAGTYYGLFDATNSPAIENSGFLTLVLKTDGFFSGTILHQGGTYEYTGRFDRSDSASVQGILGGVNRFLNLQLNPTNAAGIITGSLLGGTGSAQVQLERLASGLASSNAPPVGSYTFVVMSNSSDPLAPGGHGFGTGTLGQDGAFTVSGSLGDDTAFTASAMISQANRWPFYLTLYGGRGALLGWVSPSTDNPANLDGSLQWIKPPDPNWATYPAGFSNEVAFLASPYTAPPNDTRVLHWANGLATIADADLALGITNLVKLTTTNTINVTEPNNARIELSLDLQTGLANGSFVHPWVGTTNKVRGVILKRDDSILGQFVDGDQTGSLNLSAAPFLVTQRVANVSLPALTTALRDGGLLRFENDGVIVLTNSIVLQFDTALEANGHDVVLSGDGLTRLFQLPTNVSFSASGITFANGRHTGTNGANATLPQPGGDGCGACILNLGGMIALTNCVLTNFVVVGGDAGVDMTTNFTSTPGGRGLGAAICNRGGRVTLQDCLLADNNAVGGRGTSVSSAGLTPALSGTALGGALFSVGGECQVRDSVFLRNHALGGVARLLSSGEYSRAGDAAGGALAVTAGFIQLVSAKCLTNTAVGAGAPSTNAGAGHAYGGAFFVDSNATAVAEQTGFGANSAAGGGSGQTRNPGDGQGGAAFNAGSLLLRDCTLEQK
ncbi:MAG: hypothetical protein DME19_17140 [Verrucomicrobia bacterium]|nr:MAG: hypothetical protein DME19_17140 [Verrucomicrobiota bacterium]